MKFKPVILLLFTLFYLTPTHADVAKLSSKINTVLKVVRSDSFTIDNCSNYTENVLRALYKVNPKNIITSSSEKKLLISSGNSINKNLFLIRLALKEKLTQFNNSNLNIDNCLNSIRKANRYSRFLEEYIVKLQAKSPLFKDLNSSDDLYMAPHQVVINPLFSSTALKSGDVLLVRDDHFIGGTIARISDVPGQFNHGSLVYVDKDGRLGTKNIIYILESLIETGVIVVPLKEWKKQLGHARIIGLRAKDEKQGLAAANKVLDTILNYKERNLVIPYDFFMISEGPGSYEEIFCVELIKMGLDLASGGEIIIPTFPSSIKKLQEKTNMLEMMGIKGNSIFAPADLELDPHFNTIFEWRKPEALTRTIIRDVISDSVYNWMKDRGYEINIDGNTRLKFAYIASIIDRKLLRAFVPKGASKGFIKIYLVLEEVSKVLEKFLTNKNDAFIKTNGFMMTFPQMMSEIEKFRANDAKLDRFSSKIHRIIRPAKLK